MGLRIAPLNIKILLESNPLESRILVRRLAVGAIPIRRLNPIMASRGLCYAAARVHTPNLPTKIIPAKICGLKTSGKLSMDMRIAP